MAIFERVSREKLFSSAKTGRRSGERRTNAHAHSAHTPITERHINLFCLVAVDTIGFFFMLFLFLFS